MAIRLACPHCGTHIQVNEEWQGKRVRCGGCQKVIDVPGVAPLKISRRQREALQERPARTAPRRPAWDDDRDDDRPVRRTPPRDEAEHDEPEREGKGAPLGLILGIGGGVLALVIFIVVLILVVGKAQDDDNERRLAQANAPPLNPGQLNAAEVNPAPQLNPAPLNVNAEPKRVVNPGPVEPLPNDIAPEVVNRVKNATVYLRVTSPGGQVAEGSGFLAVEPGIVVTNAHVLGMLQATSRVPEHVEIVAHSGEPNELKLAGHVLGVDRLSDLAVLRVAGELPAPLPLEFSHKLIETQRVYIFGFPFGAQLGKNITVSQSSVSSLRKDATGVLKEIQVNGGMHSGNSGGPVVNARGHVVGVSVAAIHGTQINFAIPVEFVKLNLDGRLLESKFGEPYMHAQERRVPVHCTCLDPLNRIREMRVEVWTGNAGQSRPFSLQPPEAVAGDGPRQSFPLQVRNGIASGDVPLPDPGPGKVAWLQPVVVSATGTTQWNTARVVNPLLALERRPAALTVNLTAHKERTVRLKSTQGFALIKGKDKFTASNTVELDLLESLESHAQGALVRVGFGRPQLSFENDGRRGAPPANIAALLQRIPPTFVVDATNKLRTRTDINLNTQLPLTLREDVADYSDQICNGYEAANIVMPNRQLQPQESWPIQVPMLFKSGAKKSEIADLVLNCTYEGVRTRQDRQEALVTVNGRVQGRGNLRNGMDGQVTGKFAFDLKDGFIALLQLAITSETSVAGRDLQIVGSFHIDLRRSPGNPLNLVIPQRGSPPAAQGEIITKIDGTLGPGDPLDTDFASRGSRMKVYPVELQAGKKYTILLDSQAFDSFLRLHGPDGRLLGVDDDSGGGLNSRIDHVAAVSGAYRVTVTSFDGKGGPFSLRVLGEKGGKTDVTKKAAGNSDPGTADLVKKDPSGKFTKPARSEKPTSYMKVASAKGDYIGLGKNYSYTGEQLKVRKNDRGVSIEVDGWHCQIGAPRGQFLEVGEYLNASRFAFSGAAPGLDFFGQGRGSNRLLGHFVVWELEVQGNDVARLAIDFVQHSEERGPPLSGKIRINSSFE